MPSVNSLISQLKNNYPELTFTSSDHFRWSASSTTIFFNPQAAHAQALCLHELSHAILGHQGYHHDIDLLKLERDAWEYAQSVLAKRYTLTIHEDIIEDSLDTYREWLHARSTCPSCHANGVQTNKHLYHCVACGKDWKVNEARTCNLKRYS